MFCAHFLGTLASSLGSTVCLDTDRCIDVRALVQEIIGSRGFPVSVEELVITSLDGRPLPESATSCDVNDVRVLRLFRGG